MKNNSKIHHGRWWLLMPMVVSVMLCTSCREDYYYDEQEPEWLGESIYDFLVEQKKYTNYVRLIDELGYKEVLQTTGSKTLFVVDDDAFNAFYQNNRWNVKSYKDLTQQQKEQILYGSMLNNVFFSEKLGDAAGPQKGMSLRRTSALSVSSTSTTLAREQFPDSYYWSLIGRDTITLLKDNTPAPMVIFSNSFLVNNSLKGSDYAFISNMDGAGYVYNPSDVFVNGVRIAEANMKCKNGVVHRLERLTTPLTNMAEVVYTNDSTKRFSELLERFSAPFLSTSTTIEYGNTTPVYVKKYFTERGHSTGLDGVDVIGSNVPFMTTPTDSAVEAGLKFDPGWNTLTASDIKPMNEDMAVMFVPTDKALDDFLYYGGGKILYDVYKGWDGIPDRVLADLLNNHMKSSFVNAVPSKFDQVKNDAQVDMKVRESDIREAILCGNGVVYVSDSVYAPVSYVAVTAPTLVNDNMNIMRWATNEYGFLAYLYSMDSYYSYLLPTDEDFRYLDPLSVAKGSSEYWKFQYNNDHESVEVLVYDSLGGYKRTMKAWEGDAAVIQNRLEDLIDQHIIVDTLEKVNTGKYYYRTKGNGTVKVLPGMSANLNIYGGYQLDNKLPVGVSKVYSQKNGKTYVLPTLVQSPTKSVYKAMEEQAGDEAAPFYQFFKLMSDGKVFITDDTYATSGKYTVDVFNTYHYTIYVPSNAAIKQAIEEGLPSMKEADEYLDSLVTKAKKKLSVAQKQVYKDSISALIHDFVCYHIHDNSVYVGGDPVSNREYQTSTLDLSANLFRRVKVSADHSSLTVTDDAGTTHSVSVEPSKEGVLYNIMTRDYLFNNGITGVQTETVGDEVKSLETDITICKQIETSSFAVIHAVEGVLLYDAEQLAKYRNIDIPRIKRNFEETIKK